MTDDQQGGLRKLVFRNSVFETLGFGANQALRLGSNLILTRLLAPEAFGVMAVVNIVLYALMMLSDVGIIQSVVRSDRGDEQAFLDTAWSLSIVRGGILCLATWAVAYPASLFYEEPILVPLLAVGGLQLLIAGCESTALFTLRRRVASLQIAGIELGVQFAIVTVTIAAAYWLRSVWALLLGATFGNLVRLVWSHLIPIGYRNRPRWDPAARAEIAQFGRWIFYSSITSFLSTQFDRVMMGRLLGMSALGIYGLAILLSEAIGTLVSKVVTGVFYPTLSRVYNEDPSRLRAEYLSARRMLDTAALPALGLLAMLGDFVIELLWDPRYVEAGWMLRILCLRVAGACVMLPCEVCLVATGESRFGFARSVTTMLAIVIGVPLGFWLGGAEGLIWAVALSELPAALILWPAAIRRDLWSLRRELTAGALFALGLGLGAAIRLGLFERPIYG